MRKLRDLLDREIERQNYEWIEIKQRLTITERTEKRPVVIRSRDVELDCQSKVNQLVNSMPIYVLLRTSYLERQQLISTQPTQGVSVELKSRMAKRVHFVEAKKSTSRARTVHPEMRHFPGSQLRIVIEMRN